jgi:eukaryotic-like serine/threonine-protein kinase
MTPERYEQIRQLFHDALEREPSDRAAFLDETCGDDELRREVASLIASHEQADNFIEQPPDDVAAGWQAAITSPPESSLAHYRVFSLLGKGGMGEVWLAEDTRLGRKVAVKLLTADFTFDEGRVRRFSQEARAASSLNHPNIITIYEIGEIATKSGSKRYIATEYVEGETLRQRMTSAPNQQIPLAEAIDLAIQVTAALAAAHEAGIVHRDIKPENVMVRRDLIVKVLDFGLAKLTEAPARAVDTQVPTVPGISTETGMIMGTPRYMSPEQARAEKMDARTDIFSLGVVLYEMVTGRLPFTGTTASEVIAAILRDEAPPLAESLADAPAELEHIVSSALRKDRAERYQTARDLLVDLKELKHQIDSGTRPGRKPHATRKAPAIVTAALLALAAIVGWFYFNHKPALTEKDTILLADFENKTGEEIFDGTLKQALAIQLQQSPFLNLFPEARVRQTLGLMGRQPNERVTAQSAGEICVRNNLKALIAGAIAPLGSHYVITLEAINGQNGESLARQQVEAESREQVLRALSQAASQLRENLGESLSSIQRFDKPLEQATTSKLEAFQAWSLGIENSYGGRLLEAVRFYKLAIDLDPEFAHAYSVLSTVYGNSGRPALAAEYAEKGYRLKDNVSEFEKLRITNFYHAFSTGDLSKRIDVLKLLKSTYPRDGAGPTDLAYTYIQIGKFDEAVAEAREAIHFNPNFAPAYRALVFALLHLTRFAEAKDILAQARQKKLDSTDFHRVLYQIAFADGDLEEMNQQIDWVVGKPDEYVTSDWQAATAAFAGRWRKSQESASRAIDLAARGETKEVAARYATEQSLRGAIFGDLRRAKEDAAQGLRLARGRASLPRAALALALCGDANQAKGLVDELIKLYPEDTVINSIWVPAIRAAIELQRGNAEHAIEQLQSVSSYEAAAEFWPQYLRGLAYLKLKRVAEAAVEFQKILGNRGQASMSPLYPLAYLGLARSWTLAGDATRSLEARSNFFSLWKDADSDLPILIEAKKEFETR